MKIKSTLFSLFLILAFLVLPIKNSWAGASLDVVVTDSEAEDNIIGFFDLRDRETLIQLTHTDDVDTETFHIQIFNVGNRCQENNFFDVYTPNDTHVYNMRDITRNDGTPNTVVLPDDAYGIFVANTIDEGSKVLIGNIRILDDNGYEYRTNLVGVSDDSNTPSTDGRGFATFNFNTQAGVTLSDIVGFQSHEEGGDTDRLFLSNIRDIWTLWTVNIVNSNEDVSSCPSAVFTCADQDHPLLLDLLELVAERNEEKAANVASFEYGINEAIPSSKGAPLLCPGNIITEGFVLLELEDFGRRSDTGTGPSETEHEMTIFVGLNNGNGRGTMDVFQAETAECNTSGSGCGGDQDLEFDQD